MVIQTPEKDNHVPAARSLMLDPRPCCRRSPPQPFQATGTPLRLGGSEKGVPDGRGPAGRAASNCEGSGRQRGGAAGMDPSAAPGGGVRSGAVHAKGATRVPKQQSKAPPTAKLAKAKLEAFAKKARERQAAASLQERERERRRAEAQGSRDARLAERAAARAAESEA
ncbi:unnamed protein product [Prorocentrum cordatum]|uniref:Uncharacterized protein n=1 Tax=Prorocentrum cordatum TaxID=2364126 RepID=A0ABN9UIW3_9DINO|nr:unnamed protein product [Polarella glacialis]